LTLSASVTIIYGSYEINTPEILSQEVHILVLIKFLIAPIGMAVYLYNRKHEKYYQKHKNYLFLTLWQKQAKRLWFLYSIVEQ